MKEMGAQMKGISAPVQQMKVQMQNVQDNLDSE
jgi:hypothetical protein